jgi:hypothetical protein
MIWDSTVPATFDAAGGGGQLLEDGAVYEGAVGTGAWATLGHVVDRGVLVWRFRVESDRIDFGLVTGASPVPGDWTGGGNARGYEIWSGSNGWVRVFGSVVWGTLPNFRMAPRGSEVECTLDMGARTMAFMVNDNTPPCVAFTDIVGPVRPIVWGGRARLLRAAVLGMDVACWRVRGSIWGFVLVPALLFCVHVA